MICGSFLRLGLNSAALALMNLGAFHTALFIFNTEISYCEGDGIHQTESGKSHIGKHRETVYLGEAHVSPEDLTDILKEMKYVV